MYYMSVYVYFCVYASSEVIGVEDVNLGSLV